MQQFRRTFLGWFSAILLAGSIMAPASAGAEAVSTWQPGPGAIGDNTYDGFIDTPAANATLPTGSFTVSGWFVDKAADGWAGADDIQVFQGTMDGGGKMLARASIAQNRSDVAAALGNPFWASSGFSAGVSAGSLSAGSQTLSVYAHTPGKGWWYKQVTVNVSAGAAPAAAVAPAAPAAVPSAPVPSGANSQVTAIEKPTDGEIIPVRNDYEIIGYALDRSAAPNQGTLGSGIDRVQLFIGNDEAHGGTFLGEAQLGYSDNVPATLYGQQFGYSGWRLTFKPTQFHANTYLIFAYARSAVSGKEDSVSRFIAIHE